MIVQRPRAFQTPANREVFLRQTQDLSKVKTGWQTCLLCLLFLDRRCRVCRRLSVRQSVGSARRHYCPALASVLVWSCPVSPDLGPPLTSCLEWFHCLGDPQFPLFCIQPSSPDSVDIQSDTENCPCEPCVHASACWCARRRVLMSQCMCEEGGGWRQERRVCDTVDDSINSLFENWKQFRRYNLRAVIACWWCGKQRQLTCMCLMNGSEVESHDKALITVCANQNYTC